VHADDDGLAVVLKTIDFGETDKIVHLFVRSAGRVGAIARGARRSRKRFAGALQTGHLVRARYVIGRSDLARLESAVIVQTYDGLLSLDRGLRAGEAIALVRRVLEPLHPEPELFDAFVAYLAAESGGESAAPLAAFLLRALVLHGVGPDLSACGKCQKRPPEGRPACFDAERGTLVCRACGGAGLVLSAETRSAAISAMESAVQPPPGQIAHMLALGRLLVRYHVGMPDI
jgi:DNA repair protein RecO (recombination protein O)